jgi:hypothetical protein
MAPGPDLAAGRALAQACDPTRDPLPSGEQVPIDESILDAGT